MFHSVKNDFISRIFIKKQTNLFCSQYWGQCWINAHISLDTSPTHCLVSSLTEQTSFIHSTEGTRYSFQSCQMK